MANLPSKRTHRIRPDDTLNLTPLIDMITCLMFFLMMFACILPVVIIDAPLPKIASTAAEIKQAKDTKNKLEIMVYINSKGISVKSDRGMEKSFQAAQDGKYPFDELHKFLVQVKGKSDTKEITLMPADDTPYEVMIGVMDAARELTKDDQGYQPVPPEIANRPESSQFNRLFPDVSIGGV
jgi:biopolymer transport protein ExbD